MDVLYNPLNFERLVNNKKNALRGIWTIDDINTMQLAIENGIEFITTNDPGLCLTLKDQE